jgi:hypothetical protein
LGLALVQTPNPAATAEAAQAALDRGEEAGEEEVVDVVVQTCESGSEGMLLGLRQGDRLHQVGHVALGPRGSVARAKELLKAAKRPLLVVFERPPRNDGSDDVAPLPGMPLAVDYGSCDEALAAEPGSYSRLRFTTQPTLPLGFEMKVVRGRLVVASVDAEGPHEAVKFGLQAGDEVVAVNGVPWSSRSRTEEREAAARASAAAGLRPPSHKDESGHNAVALRRGAGLGQSAFCFSHLLDNAARPLVLTLRRSTPEGSRSRAFLTALARFAFAPGATPGAKGAPGAYEAPSGHKPAKYSVADVERARQPKSMEAEEKETKQVRPTSKEAATKPHPKASARQKKSESPSSSSSGSSSEEERCY